MDPALIAKILAERASRAQVTAPQMLYASRPPASPMNSPLPATTTVPAAPPIALPANIWARRAAYMAALAAPGASQAASAPTSPSSSVNSNASVATTRSAQARLAISRTQVVPTHFWMEGEILKSADGESLYDLGDGSTFGGVISRGDFADSISNIVGGHGRVIVKTYGGKQYIIKKIVGDRNLSVKEINQLANAQSSGYGMKLLAAQVSPESVGGAAYILSDYVPGKDLGDWIRDNSDADSRRKKQIINQVIDGIEALHTLGIIHRDIKPENIWVPDDTSKHIFFLDFGSATRLGAPSLYLGTERFMRENKRGSLSSSPANVTDNYYALGVTIDETVPSNADATDLSTYYKDPVRRAANEKKKFTVGGRRRRRNKRTTRRSRYGRH